jgi:uncharacterized protein (DUF1501 family)
MQRRQFLKRTLQAGAILPLASAGLYARPLGSSFFARPAAAGDRVLVLINLNGGNDGLNTIIPVDDAAYYNARQTLAIAKSQTLPIATGLGLHPSMTGVRALYDRGECAIVQSVGYEDQDRSHFRSTDIWHTGSDAAEILYTGWLGRYLETIHPEYPTTLPVAPFAIQIASSVTLALQSDQGNMGIAIDNPDRFYNLANGLKVPTDPVPNTLAGPELEYIRSIIEQSNEFSSGIHDAMINAPTTSVTYDNDSLSAQLKIVARLINGGLETGIYVVTLAGFDTHQGQLTRHAQLLAQLSGAVTAFLADVTAAGNGDRVAVATYSEFGRRLNENGSAGTDHGAAAPQLVFGRKVLGGTVIGGPPNLTDLDERGDVKYVNDYRQIYASILEDWLGLAHTDTVAALGGEFSKLPLFAAASSSADRETAAYAGVVLEQNTPNPARSTTTIAFSIPRPMHVSIELRTSNGRTVRRLVDRSLDAGAHRVGVALDGLASGTYLYTLSAAGYRVSQWMSVVE